VVARLLDRLVAGELDQDGATDALKAVLSR
jgi:hypothetical protein